MTKINSQQLIERWVAGERNFTSEEWLELARYIPTPNYVLMVIILLTGKEIKFKADAGFARAFSNEFKVSKTWDVLDIQSTDGGIFLLRSSEIALALIIMPERIPPQTTSQEEKNVVS